MKKMSKNPYSFYTINQSDIYDFTDSTEEDIENSILSNTMDNDSSRINIFEQNDKILHEYHFSDNSSILYRKFGDDKLALLYQSQISENDNIDVSIYTPTTYYYGDLKFNKFNTIACINFYLLIIFIILHHEFLI